VVCQYTNEWSSCLSYLGNGLSKIIEAELWVIGLTLAVAIKKSETLQMHDVKIVAVLSDSQATIR